MSLKHFLRGVCQLFACGAVALASGMAFGQSPAQIQFTYDAAGNLVQATRVAMPDLVVTNLTVGTISVQTSGAFNIPVSFQITNVGAGVATGTLEFPR